MNRWWIVFVVFHIGLARAAEISFVKGKIKIGEKQLTVEIADTDAKRSRGLMFRKSLDQGQGMLFIFEYEQPLAFWMKNTLIPLSIGYFNSKKILVDIKEMNPPQSMMVLSHVSYPSAKPARYAVEVPQGWYRKNKIKIGTKFEFIK